MSARGLFSLSHLDPPMARFIAANQWALGITLTGMSVAYLAGFRPVEFALNLLILAVDFGLLMAIPALSRRTWTVGSATFQGEWVAVIVLLLTISSFAFGGVYFAPHVLPLAVLLLLAPLLVGLAYLGTRTVNVVSAYVIIATIAVAVLSEWSRPMHGPTYWVTGALVVGLSLPPVVIVVVLAVREALRRSQDQAEEVRNSQREVVQAMEQARRTLERDIHDGAQQQLVVQSVQIGLAQQAIRAGEILEVARLLEQLSTSNHQALNDLRELARGIYPPLLAERGLAVAVRSQARNVGVPVRVIAPNLPRFPSEIESAVYFCISEALQNAVKHSQATQVDVRLDAADGLRFTVTDDGVGFDPALDRGASAGASFTGLRGLQVRMASVGGILSLQSTPGQGVTVSGWIPSSATAEFVA